MDPGRSEGSVGTEGEERKRSRSRGGTFPCKAHVCQVLFSLWGGGRTKALGKLKEKKSE